MDVGLGFGAATDIDLGKTDPSMRMGQIAIQRQRLLTFSNALRRAVCENYGHAQIIWARACCGAMDRALINAASAAARYAARSSVSEAMAAPSLKSFAMPTIASILPGSSAKARSKKPRACVKYSGVIPLVHASHALEIQVHRIGMQ